jgi:hypothetical protein
LHQRRQQQISKFGREFQFSIFTNSTDLRENHFAIAIAYIDIGTHNSVSASAAAAAATNDIDNQFANLPLNCCHV